MILFEERGEPACGGDCALRGLPGSFQEEGEPRLPVPVPAHRIEQRVVGGAVLLEVEAQIQERLSENTGVTEQKCDQETPYATIAVEEGMDRLELHVREACADEDRQARGVVMKEPLERRHRVLHEMGRRRHEVRVARSA